jgi:putative FmdB family regulatory protein
MPIYEYLCRQCNEEFELLVRDGQKPACPSCGQRRLTKLLSAPVAHTVASQPPCPAKEAGACQMPSCGGGGCGLTPLG